LRKEKILSSFFVCSEAVCRRHLKIEIADYAGKFSRRMTYIVSHPTDGAALSGYSVKGLRQARVECGLQASQLKRPNLVSIHATSFVRSVELKSI
jgi:hypothetical protein